MACELLCIAACCLPDKSIAGKRAQAPPGDVQNFQIAQNKKYIWRKGVLKPGTAKGSTIIAFSLIYWTSASWSWYYPSQAISASGQMVQWDHSDVSTSRTIEFKDKCYPGLDLDSTGPSLAWCTSNCGAENPNAKFVAPKGFRTAFIQTTPLSRRLPNQSLLLIFPCTPGAPV